LLLSEAVLLAEADGRVQFLSVVVVAQGHHLTEGVPALRIRVPTVVAAGCDPETGCVGGAWRLHLADISDEFFELLDAEKFLVDDLLRVLVDAVIGV